MTCEKCCKECPKKIDHCPDCCEHECHKKGLVFTPKWQTLIPCTSEQPTQNINFQQQECLIKEFFKNHPNEKTALIYCPHCAPKC